MTFPIFQIDYSDPTIATATIVIVLIVLFLLYFFLFRGVFLVSNNQIGVLIKKFGGQRMPQGQIVARKGQIGIQAHTLMPGLYFRNPIIWQVKKYAITEILEDQVGVVESIDGEALPKARLLGDAVESAHFQDGEAFLDNHGKKGPQIDILQPGKYRINALLFKVTPMPATMIGSNEVAILTAARWSTAAFGLYRCPKTTGETRSGGQVSQRPAPSLFPRRTGLH